LAAVGLIAPYVTPPETVVPPHPTSNSIIAGNVSLITSRAPISAAILLRGPEVY
jgi:hypothetical protein